MLYRRKRRKHKSQKQIKDQKVNFFWLTYGLWDKELGFNFPHLVLCNTLKGHPEKFLNELTKEKVRVAEIDTLEFYVIPLNIKIANHLKYIDLSKHKNYIKVYECLKTRLTDYGIKTLYYDIWLNTNNALAGIAKEKEEREFLKKKRKHKIVYQDKEIKRITSGKIKKSEYAKFSIS